MISFLKQHKFGRATFLPLTSVKGSEFLKPESAQKKMASSDWPTRWLRRTKQFQKSYEEPAWTYCGSGKY